MQGFHSLPPGKPFRTNTLLTQVSKEGVVSIPFHRESPFGHDGEFCRCCWENCFHSLPPGKSFRTKLGRWCSKVSVICFHSLPPGKSFRTEEEDRQLNKKRQSFHSLPPGKSFRTKHTVRPKKRNREQVSIPFHRESLSKEIEPWRGYGCSARKVSIPFQRESLSKAERLAGTVRASWHVSIPFQRESLSKARYWYQSSWRHPFPFPSNGKVYPKTEYPLSLKYQQCFHSLPTGKHIQSMSAAMSHIAFLSFHSLPTGKHIQRISNSRHRVALFLFWFPFPSNGKAYPKSRVSMRYW